MKLRFLFLWMMAVALPSIGADVLDFSYNVSENPEVEKFGYGKTEVYDIAVLLKNTAFEGSRITGISVPVVADTANIKECSVWLSSALRLKNEGGKKLNDPDIIEIPAALSTDGMLDVDFPEPYLLTSDGVYVGYSFKVTALTDETKRPVAYVDGEDAEGLYVHAVRSQANWKSVVTNVNGVSPMIIRLEGSFPDDAAIFDIPEENYILVGHEGSLKVKVTNHSSHRIETVSYSYKVGNGETYVGAMDLPDPITGKFGAFANISLPIKAIDCVGTFDIDFNLEKVNNHPNVMSGPLVRKLVSMPFIACNRPIVEEYTGLWCGYCPRGYVALEQLNKTYGHDKFVAVAYHDGDPMATMAAFPSQVAGYPGSYINRKTELDPGLLPDIWPSVREEVTVAQINVDVKWNPDLLSGLLEADAKVSFVKDIEDSPYRIAYILVADGLTDPTWMQSNNYSGADYSGDFWPLFTEAGGIVIGLVFNDVAVMAGNYMGEEDSLPSYINVGEEIRHSYIFDIKEACNRDGNPVIQNPEKLRVIAMVVDSRSGEVVNSCSSDYAVEVSHSEILNESRSVKDVIYYDLMGNRVESHQAGRVMIMKEIFNDGTSRVIKIMP